MVYALAWFVMHIKSRFKNKIQESQPERGTSDLAETPPGKEVYGKRPQKETQKLNQLGLSQAVKRLRNKDSRCRWTSRPVSGRNRRASLQGPRQLTAGAGPHTPSAAGRGNGRLK